MRLGIVQRAVVAFGLSHFRKFQGVGSLPLDALHSLDLGRQPRTFPHQRLSGIGIIPQRGILGPRVEFVQAS